MADTATPRRRLSVAEFLRWEEQQEEKFELIDGIPQAMAGGSRNHTTIALNIASTLKGKLRGSACLAFTSDLKTVADENIYYPDVTVDCGTANGRSLLSAAPTIVFEVLSRTTRHTDFRLKLPSYQATPSIQQIVFVETEARGVTVWTRAGDIWNEFDAAHDQPLRLESVGVELSFAEIYEDIDFAA